jgi:3-dehydroquinate synthase
MATSIHVALGERSYDIVIDRDCLSRSAEFVQARLPKTSHAVIITDANVRLPHAEAVRNSLVQGGMRCDVMVVPAGEASKSVAQAEYLWNQLVSLSADRKTVIVAVGGGVVGDLAGFAAATFGRGLAFVQIPTTLLAQVDSSVGGKVGINLPAAKNIVGSFWQPAGVLIDLNALATLPEREYTSGLAEVVKYGVILDAGFFEYLEQNIAGLIARQPEVLEHIVARSCRLKADVVECDEREETGRRAVLNYGHTFGHAIETATDYGRFLHGEAIAIGMVCASRLAESLRRIESGVTERQIKLLTSLGLKVDAEGLSLDDLMTAMQRDKKAERGNLRFVLPNKLGHVELVGDIDPALVRKAWN